MHLLSSSGKIIAPSWDVEKCLPNVTAAKAGVEKTLQSLDAGFRGLQ